jgi:hypothetical protein
VCCFWNWHNLWPFGELMLKAGFGSPEAWLSRNAVPIEIGLFARRRGISMIVTRMIRIKKWRRAEMNLAEAMRARYQHLRNCKAESVMLISKLALA